MGLVDTSSFVMIAMIAMVGAMSPGPDFAVVVKNSLTCSRRAGLYTALGVTLGVCIHMLYCLFGIGFFIAESPLLFNCIKYSGAAYLVYLGVKSLVTRPVAVAIEGPSHLVHTIPSSQAFKTGLFTNMLNPKATLFFVSLFSQVIDPQTTLSVQIIYALEIVLLTWGWFCALAFLLSHEVVRARIARMQNSFEKVMGALLLMLGLKVAFI